LEAAVRTKLKKLDAELSILRCKTRQLTWLSPVWWGEEDSAFDSMMDLSDDGLPDGMIQFEDWVILDAMYRSRALELPSGAEAMVPAIDIANHEAMPAARFEVEDNGDAVLLLETQSLLNEGTEVCINYGSHKSALEFIFTYGFLPNRTNEPESILLSLPRPEDDPLLMPKVNIVSVSNCVPAIKISDRDGSIQWDSEVLCLMNLNEEDGLDFSLTGESGENLHLMWKDEPVDLIDLRARLEKDEKWDLFHLRAVVTILTQVERQILGLRAWKEDEMSLSSTRPMERLDEVKKLATDFRAIEESLLTRALSYFGDEVWRKIQPHFDTDSLQKLRLIQSSVVIQYFNGLHGNDDGPQGEEDNSFV
jgi:hypothetical protein